MQISCYFIRPFDIEIMYLKCRWSFYMKNNKITSKYVEVFRKTTNKLLREKTSNILLIYM